MQTVTAPGVRKRSLDTTDERILRLLVRDARASYREIAAEVSLSANAVAQRMRRLEAAGLIRGYTAVLDPALESAGVSAVVHVRTSMDFDALVGEAAMAALPDVVEVLDLAGPIDYEIRVRSADPQALSATVNAIRALPGITAMETRTILREVIRRGSGR